jgi:hypothetical protein
VTRCAVAIAALLGSATLVLSAPSVGGAAVASASSASQSAHCAKAAKGHAKLTKADIASCKAVSSRVISVHKCPSGPSVTAIRLSSVDFALRQGSRSVRLGKNVKAKALSALCGKSTKPSLAIPATTAPPPTTTTTQPPPPTTTTRPPPPATTVPPPPATTTPPPVPTTVAPASCYPLTDGGNCYEPGEFCRDSDHGATGRAGDGKTITCEDNDGWRWEPT